MRDTTTKILKSAESTDVSIEDAEPEPVAEPECTYKTNDLLNDESWLLVCSTVGCAFAGAGKNLFYVRPFILYNKDALYSACPNSVFTT